MEWLSVADAARDLGVGEPQVRRLARAGVLSARRIPAGWLIDAASVRRRPQLAPAAGRPLSPRMAWLLLLHLDAGDEAAPGKSGGHVPVDRKDRYRMRQLLSSAPEPPRWSQWLRRRADPHRVWVHPGVLDRLAADPRLRPGGGFAAAAAGVGLAAGPPRRFYVGAGDLNAVMSAYHAREDLDGQIELMVIPESVPAGLRPGPGAVPKPVAFADLLDSEDARERHAGLQFAGFARQNAQHGNSAK